VCCLEAASIWRLTPCVECVTHYHNHLRPYLESLASTRVGLVVDASNCHI